MDERQRRLEEYKAQENWYLGVGMTAWEDRQRRGDRWAKVALVLFIVLGLAFVAYAGLRGWL